MLRQFDVGTVVLRALRGLGFPGAFGLYMLWFNACRSGPRVLLQLVGRVFALFRFSNSSTLCLSRGYRVRPYVLQWSRSGILLLFCYVMLLSVRCQCVGSFS